MQLEHHPKSNLSVEAPTTQAWPPKRGGKKERNTKSSIPVRSSKGPTNQELSKIEMEIGWVGSDRVGPAQFTS